MAGFGSMDASFDDRFPAEPSTAQALTTGLVNGARAWWDGAKWVAGGSQGPQPPMYTGGPSYPLQEQDLQKYAYQKLALPNDGSPQRPVLWGALDANPGNVEDRRGETLSPADQARITLGQVNGVNDPAEIAARIKAAGITPLGMQLGLAKIPMAPVRRDRRM